MNTPSHAILNLAILNQYQRPQANLFIVIGAILPDIPIFVFYLLAKFVYHLPERQIWSTAYYQTFWQNIIATFHSIPLALIGWVIARYLGWKHIEIVFASMVLHSLLDFPVHSDDAHRHFFPFSNFRFISPISYWDPHKYGKIVSFIERLLVLVATLYVFPFVHSYIGKGLLIAVNMFYWLSFIAKIFVGIF
ncbi:MAG: hypothetical protein KME08_11750 [Aphanothece sp. CMT-3BRIN-NPC111]|nr:hypothetical protein [Aphanothece sp. CMT-3BRIN-NPC111]